MSRDYKYDIRIDRSDLENEWEEHPALYMHYSDLYDDAVEHKDNIKLKLEYLAAKLDLDIRKKPKKYGFDGKPTEAAIKSTIKLNKKYHRLEKKLISATKTINGMVGVKRAFEHRKSALSDIVSMKISGFHSEPGNKVRTLRNKKYKERSNEQLKELNKKGGKRKKKK